MKKLHPNFITLLLLTLMMLFGAALAEEAHEPITIMDANRDYRALIELVHEKYPEINIQIVPYRGKNTTDYMKKQLVTGYMPDIYCTTQALDGDLQAEHLVDLSQYAVTDLYNAVRMGEMDVDGAVYLLPYDYNIMGIWCNVSLLERNGIAVPTSFRELREETIPALNAAGITVSECQLYLPGLYFQMFCNISGTAFLNTLEGRTWMRDFIDLSTDVGAVNQPELQECLELFQQWIDCGMIHTGDKEENAFPRFAEGNTAFYVGTATRYTQNEDGTGDQYILLPYLSEDGTQNVYITQNSRCYGLNKHLEEPGNEQKLQDALHVLEVMSTMEGYRALIGDFKNIMCSIREFSVPEDSPYYEAVRKVSVGYEMPIVYNGWEDYMVTFGEAVHAVIEGRVTTQEALETLDQTKAQLQTQGETYYAVVTEVLDTAQSAQLVGQMFMDATNADVALISYNVYYPEVASPQENVHGVNGQILPGNMSEGDIVIFLPTGWYDNIVTMEATGAEIMEIAREGFDLRGNGYPYPYVLLAKDGQALADDVTYTVAICGLAKERKATLTTKDTGIVGLDAAKAYLLKVGTVSTATLDNSLLLQIGE